MGGKSTLLRQTCLAALLAHVGAWVPAESLRLSPVDALFVRMGGTQQDETCCLMTMALALTTKRMALARPLRTAGIMAPRR